ncbi:MAG: OmpA family protein [Undibacterium sp.]|nr:OmpA family protein [Undibacterium sp.]MDO9192682.1 OmpA family protein [Undibacterium sp.]
MIKKITFACLLTSLALPTFAQTDIQALTPNSAYGQDARGKITRSGFGLCWRTGYWTSADSTPGCDGELLAPVAKPITPEVVAPIASPAPAPVAPKPAAPKRCDFAITLQSDETFDFNKALLKNGAKQRIDKDVMDKLATCVKLDLVIVTGHTDLIGDHKYNQKLSEKRADAVATYLTSKGVSAPIDTMGMGKTQQIKFCDEKLSQTKLFECLAPNRRVVIEGRGLAK